MQFRKAISEIKALQYVFELLDIRTPMGKKKLMNMEMICEQGKLDVEFDLIENLMQEDPKIIAEIQVWLSHLRDIFGTLRNLEQNLNLNDVELFEIKSFVFHCHEIFKLHEKFSLQAVKIPKLSALIPLLDPQNTGILSFYIYDDYSEQLATARKKLKAGKKSGKSSEELELLFHEASEIEQKVREELCWELRNFTTKLFEAYRQLAHLDLLIAKSVQAKKIKLNRPKLVESKTAYTALFNPMIKDELEQQNKKYQPINIELEKSVCLITGANMSGKTVILKTLALCQYLCQFGFFVPALKAEISLVDCIMIFIGDELPESNSFSSFASEMLCVNQMIKASRNETEILILIDELARTTNPIEGVAIVNAVADIFAQHHTKSVITTHYSHLKPCLRKLRVKGLDQKLDEKNINKNNMNHYMDYSLIEDNTNKAPHEALRVASLLGIDSELIEKAKQQLKPTLPNSMPK